MALQLAALTELRKCSAVPNFVHMFNVLHVDYLNLPRLDIDEYEYALLPADVKHPGDVHDPVVFPNIVIKLLKGCGQAYVREDTCFDILRSLTLRKWHVFAHPGVPCPFVGRMEETSVPEETVPELVKETGNPSGEPMDVDTERSGIEPASVDCSADSTSASLPKIVETVPAVPVTADQTEENDPHRPALPVPASFHDLKPTDKAEIMLVLLNTWMMSHLIKTNFIDNIEPSLLRVSPCGHDQRGNLFFYLFGTRLYKESNTKHDALTGTGTYDWELVTADAEGFSTVLAGLKKFGVTSRNRALINQLEKNIIPGLAACFEEKNQCDLQRRMEFRRRRSVALQLAKEKARLERQEATAARNANKRMKLADGSEGLCDAWSSEKPQSTAASRAERYKRRSQLIGQDEAPATDGSVGNRSWRAKYDEVTRAPETREDLLEKTRKLLVEWLTRQNEQWPFLPTM